MAGAEPSGEMKNQKLHAVVARSKFESQNVKKTSCSNGKVCATVARSAFGSQNVKST